MIGKNYNGSFFQRALIEWNEKVNNRQMPWKGEPDPYKIWISEIILQQTRVEQGWDYYLRFIDAYPTIAQLALAPEEEVFKLWEGLGYYSRCRNLLAAARQVMEHHAGVFPGKHEEILKLKGVGPYTAAAIASFAFQLPFAVVDGNVVRVLARFFGIHTAFDTTEGRKHFAALAQKLINKQNPGVYNQAIMDFGATVCKPAEPNCLTCPLKKCCVSFSTNQVKLLPVKSKKIVRKNRWLCYWIIQNGNKLLIRQRTSKDIWHQLHEFYLLENPEAFDWTEKEIASKSLKIFGTKAVVHSKSAVYTQQLTHQTIHATFVGIQTQPEAIAPEGYKWQSLSAIKKLPFPKIINSFILEKGGLKALLYELFQ